MIGLLLKLIDPIGAIAKEISRYKQAELEAESDGKRIDARERVKTLEARRDVMVAEGGSRINAIVRAFIAAGPAIYLFKIFVYDKVLGLGATDPLTPELWNVVIAVLGFYFLHDALRVFKR